MQLRNGKTIGIQPTFIQDQSFLDFIDEFVSICEEFTLRYEKTIDRLIALYDIYDFTLSYISKHTHDPAYPMFSDLFRKKTNALFEDAAIISYKEGNDPEIRHFTLKLFAIMFDTLAFIGANST